MKFSTLLLIAVLSTGCVIEQVSDNQPNVGVEQVLDDWHQAAAEGDFNRYFDHFADSNSIFMGTDATERWTIAEFKPWAQPYFEDDGVAWTFTPFNRVVYYSKDNRMAWFDEELDTPNLGISRGSGVLLVKDGAWKIVHYNLAVPIPNAIVDDVVNQIEEELKKTQD